MKAVSPWPDCTSLLVSMLGVAHTYHQLCQGHGCELDIIANANANSSMQMVVWLVLHVDAGG